MAFEFRGARGVQFAIEIAVRTVRVESQLTGGLLRRGERERALEPLASRQRRHDGADWNGGMEAISL